MKYIYHYYKRIEALLEKHKWLFGVCLVLLAALLAVTRRPDVFLNAQFWAEDGAVWYTDAYQNGFWNTILKPYPDYLAVPQRLFAFLSTLIPFSLAPLCMNVMGLGFQLLPVILLAGGRLKRLVPSRLLAIFITIVYISLPNTGEVFSTFANAQWHLALAALLVIAGAQTANKPWRIFEIAVLIAGGLSGPMVIFLAPVVFLQWWLHKKQPVYLQNLLLVSALALLQVGVLLLANSAFRDGTPPDQNILHVVKMVAGQIFTGGILGQDYVAMFYDHHKRLYLTLFIGLSLTAYAIIKGPVWLKLLNIYSPLIVTAVLATLKNPPDSAYDVWIGLTNPTGGQRYWYIPIVIWITTILWLAFRAKNTIVRGTSIVLVIMLVTIGIPQNWHIAPLKDYQFKTHAQAFDLTPRGQSYTLPINPGNWVMTLRKK